MKKAIRSLLIVIALALSAAFVPLLGGTQSHDDGYSVTGKVMLTEYNGGGERGELAAEFSEHSDSSAEVDYDNDDSYGDTYSRIVITEQPESQFILAGNPVTLSVVATGEDLNYQWYFKKAGQDSFRVWNNRTYSSETVTPNATWDGIQLYCNITDSIGNSIDSDIATIRVLSIVKQPTDQTAVSGNPVTVSLRASGEGLTYQWYFKKAGQDSFSVWNNRTHASETVTPNVTWNGIQLYCLVKDTCGNSVKSNTITVTIISGLEITEQPTDKTVILGDSVTLSLKANGSGVTYQWYFKKAGQDSFSVWNNRTHASETVTPNATWDGIQLYCIVKDTYGNSVKSNTITVTIISGLEITQQPTDKTVILGDSVTLSLKANGSGVTYQWYFKKAGQDSFSVWNNRTHASETVTPNATWNGIQLYCIVKDTGGNSIKSNTITVKIIRGLTITEQPTDKTINLGDFVTLSLKAKGSGVTYQWYYKKQGQNSFSVWNGRSSSVETVMPNYTWNGIQLYCLVKDTGGNSIKSNTITVTIVSSITITEQPTDKIAALGQSVTLQIKAKGSGLTYQWYVKKKGAVEFTAWGGRSSSIETFTPDATWNGAQVYCLVKDTGSACVKSDTITITLV